MPTDVEELEARLAELGERRKSHNVDAAKLSQEIREALDEAEGVISATRQAKLIGVARTTLYRTYR